MDTYLYCPRCGHLKIKIEGLEIGDGNCLYCGTPLLNTNHDCEYFMNAVGGADHIEKKNEYIRQQYVYNNPQFDPEQHQKYLIEYEKTCERNRNSTNVKCPACNSNSVSKISGANKVGSAALFGLFSLGHISKTFKCSSCGYKF